MILVVANIKGGVGKTTLAVNLAVERTLRGKADVLLVDADDQGTATDFTSLREHLHGKTGYTAIQLSGAAVRSQVLAMKDKFHHIIIDVGGRDTTALRAALTVADTVLLPFQPRSFDVWAMDRIGELITEARLINPSMTVSAVLSCADSQGSDNRDAAQAMDGHEIFSLLDAMVGRRKAFPNAASQGLSVLEMANPDSKACNELKFLADRLFA
jgi:chromosome partitioning protein